MAVCAREGGGVCYIRRCEGRGGGGGGGGGGGEGEGVTTAVGRAERCEEVSSDVGGDASAGRCWG